MLAGPLVTPARLKSASTRSMSDPVEVSAETTGPDAGAIHTESGSRKDVPVRTTCTAPPDTALSGVASTIAGGAAGDREARTSSATSVDGSLHTATSSPSGDTPTAGSVRGAVPVESADGDDHA